MLLHQRNKGAEMQYPIPGVWGTTITRLGNEFVISTNKESKVYSLKEPVTLSIKKVECTKPAIWFYLLAYYGIQMPDGYEEYVKEIEFHNRVYGKSTNDTRAGYTIVFNNPVVYKEDPNYRLIARCPYYAIDKDGTIINVNKGEIVSIKKEWENESTYYPTFSFSNNRVGRNTTKIHILVASTWIENNDYSSKVIVDHIDGNKGNYNANNLRWVTVSENNKYAVVQSNKHDALSCRVRNVITGEITSFPSTTQAAEYMGKSRFSVSTSPLANGRKYVVRTKRGVFEIKLDSDKDPWLTDEQLIGKVKYYDSYRLEVKLCGKTYIFTNIIDINVFLENDRLEVSVSKMSKDIKKKYPESDITLHVDRTEITPSIIAKNLETEEVMYNTSRTELFKICKVAESSGRKSISSNGGYAYNNWVFKYDDGNEFAPVEKSGNTRTRVILKNIESGKKQIFNSIREAARFINCDKKTIAKAALNNKYLLNKYKVKLVQQ